MTDTTTEPTPPSPPTSEANSGPAMPPARRRKTSRRVLVVFALLVVAFVFLLVEGLGSSLDYFDTVDQALAHKTSLGTQTFRLEGTVVPGSIHPTATGTDFLICQGPKSVPVTNTGSPPQLFAGPHPRRGGRPLRLGPLDRVRVQHHHGQALVDLQRPVPGSGQGDVGRTGLLMLDAHIGTIGVWLAFVASVCGAAVIAFGLFTHRHDDGRGRRRLARPDGDALGQACCGRGTGADDGRWFAAGACWPARCWPSSPWSTRCSPTTSPSSSWPRTTAR